MTTTESHSVVLARGKHGTVSSDGLRRISTLALGVAFLALAETTLRTKLAYRTSALLAMLTSLLGYSVFLLVWLAVYRGGGGPASIPEAAMIPYLIASMAVNASLTLSVEMRFWMRLRKGAIVSDLLKPLGFMPYQLAQALGDVMANLIFSVPLLIAGRLILGPFSLTSTSPHALLGAISLCLAFLINFALSYCFVQAAFLTRSLYGLQAIRMAAHFALSGLSAPLEAFPARLRAIATYLPFRHVIATPVRILLGQVATPTVADLLLLQLCWAAALLSLGAWLFRFSSSRHEIQGG